MMNLRKALWPAILLAFVPTCSNVFGQPPPRPTGYIPSSPLRTAALRMTSMAKHGGRIAMLVQNQALPDVFDCREKNWMPACDDQGNCGSCYEVATVRQMTCILIKAGYGKPDGSFRMSFQFGMDRPRNFGGCGGGNGTEVVSWACSNGWIAEKYVDLQGVAHNDYPPYEARSGNDRTKPGAKKWMTDATWGFVNDSGNPTFDEICAAMYNYGPLNIALDAGGQFGSGTGTITSLGNNINHEILATGYNRVKKTITLNNQWSEDWGVGGYREITADAATRHIVDWFFVSASPLPPPPPPPPPPGPIPPPVPGGVTITLSHDLKAGTYFIAPNGSIVLDPKMTLEELLNRKWVGRDEPETKEPPKLPPIPPVEKPTPTMPPAPMDPAPTAGLRVLIVYCEASKSKLPVSQQAVLSSPILKAWLKANCASGATSPDGKEWWIVDKGEDLSSAGKHWTEAMKRPRASLPWIIVSNGKTGFEGPLPKDVPSTIELLSRYKPASKPATMNGPPDVVEWVPASWMLPGENRVVGSVRFHQLDGNRMLAQMWK